MSKKNLTPVNLPLLNPDPATPNAGDLWVNTSYGGSGVRVYNGSATNNLTTVAGAEPLRNKTMYVVKEAATQTATPSATVNFDFITNSVFFVNADATANVTLNIRGDSGTTLASLVANSESISGVFLMKNGSPAYYVTTFQVDGTTSGVTTRWLSAAPTSGNANAVDAYSFTAYKDNTGAWNVFVAQSKYV